MHRGKHHAHAAPAQKAHDTVARVTGKLRRHRDGVWLRGGDGKLARGVIVQWPNSGSTAVGAHPPGEQEQDILGLLLEEPGTDGAVQQVLLDVRGAKLAQGEQGKLFWTWVGFGMHEQSLAGSMQGC
jgi:hypothetical protein